MKAIAIYSEIILLDEKIYKNILICDISYKLLWFSKRLRIWFEKINGFIKIYDGIRYLKLLVHISNDDVCDKRLYCT